LVNKNVLSCLLKDGKEVNAVVLVGRLFHARATVTRNDRSPMVLSRVREMIRRSGVDRNRMVVDAVVCLMKDQVFDAQLVLRDSCNKTVLKSVTVLSLGLCNVNCSGVTIAATLTSTF